MPTTDTPTVSVSPDPAAAVAEPTSLERFQADTTEHQLTVLHDDGAYRHLRFSAPGTGFYYFDLLTAPGLLTITGDMGTYVFSRIPDMLEFFELRKTINPVYWAESLLASKEGVHEHSPEKFVQQVTEYFDAVKHRIPEADRDLVWERITRNVLTAASHDESARYALQYFNDHGFTFDGWWEWKFEILTSHYLWCCNAILWGIRQYRESGQK